MISNASSYVSTFVSIMVAPISMNSIRIDHTTPVELRGFRDLARRHPCQLINEFFSFSVGFSLSPAHRFDSGWRHFRMQIFFFFTGFELTRTRAKSKRRSSTLSIRNRRTLNQSTRKMSLTWYSSPVPCNISGHRPKLNPW